MLVFASGTTLTINPFVYSNMGFDSKKALDPVIKFGGVPNVLVVNPAPPRASRGIHAVPYMKAHPDELNYASTWR